MVFSSIFLVFFCLMAAPLFIVAFSVPLTPIAIVAIELEILGIIITATDVCRSAKRHIRIEMGEMCEEEMEPDGDEEEFEES